MSYKLGKKLGVVEDPRTFKLTPLLTQAVKVPKTFHFDHNQTEFPMFANDSYGDCTCASQGHRIVAQEKNSRQKEIALTDGDILAVYSAVTGFDPNDPNTDNGAYCLDVLNYMRRTGMGMEKDGSTHTIYAYAKVDHTNHDEVKLASYLFGGVYTGVALPVSAQNQIGKRWSVTTAEASPGGWGGHAMSTLGYDEKGPLFVTWGSIQPADWAWWDKYVDECYAVISEDWINSKTNKTRSGVDLLQLESQLAALR